MKISLVKDLKQSATVLAGVYSDGELPSCLNGLDKDARLVLLDQIKACQIPGQMRFCQLPQQTVILIQLGNKDDYQPKTLKKMIAKAIPLLAQQGYDDLCLCFPTIQGIDTHQQLRHMVLAADAAAYRCTTFKTDKSKISEMTSLGIHLPDATEDSLNKAKHIANAIRLCRDMGNTPANICTPEWLAQQSMMLAAKHHQLNFKVLDDAEMAELGMNTLLAVGKGSDTPPCLIELNYQRGGDARPFVLVGKGITFDSGGLSMKAASMMDEMKYDMCGAASVIAVIDAIASLDLPINVVGLIPAAENMVSGHASRPGDIVTSMSGKTVEIMNTDAEGRLILADTLTYAERFEPQWVIDIATLTGAMVIALGGIRTGMMCADDELASEILAAGQRSLDLAWRMPLDDEYGEAMESPLADVMNATQDRTAGSITAACFLSRFTKAYRWAHLDIAGTAWISGKNRDATGRPVALLVDLLEHMARAR